MVSRGEVGARLADVLKEHLIERPGLFGRLLEREFAQAHHIVDVPHAERLLRAAMASSSSRATIWDSRMPTSSAKRLISSATLTGTVV
jgi:hypothetical protein